MESFIYSSGYPTQIIRFKQKSQFNLDPQSEQSFKNSILNPKRPSFSSSPPMRVAGGKIIEVKGGHFVPSTSRKDQHNKICTAKGLRDRRFRLSARTAIKFYDVQDRLGYDRPSKAVDWLIKNAKASIDELAEASEKQMKPVSDPFSFLPPSLDSDAIADTIKSFFPVAQQDLRISLQSFQDPFFQQNPGDSVERGTLQSSDLISVPWMDPAELQMHPMASIEFSRFHIPARIGGEEEHKGGCCSCQR